MLGVGLGINAVSSVFTPIDGGGDPPAGSIAHFSFAQNSYWTQADGDLTAAQIISDPGTITAGLGYVGGNNIALLSPIYPYLGLAKTVVLRGRLFIDPEQDFNGNLDLVDCADDPDLYNEGVTYTVQVLNDAGVLTLKGKATGYDDSGGSLDLGGAWHTVTPQTVIRFDTAYTIRADGASLSFVGNAVDTGSGTLTIPSIGVATLVRLETLEFMGVSIAFESITVYAEQLDADLPTLATPL